MPAVNYWQHAIQNQVYNMYYTKYNTTAVTSDHSLLISRAGQFNKQTNIVSVFFCALKCSQNAQHKEITTTVCFTLKNLCLFYLNMISPFPQSLRSEDPNWRGLWCCGVIKMGMCRLSNSHRVLTVKTLSTPAHATDIWHSYDHDNVLLCWLKQSIKYVLNQQTPTQLLTLLRSSTGWLEKSYLAA